MKVIFGSLLMESEGRATSLFYDLYHLLSSKTLLLSGVGVRGDRHPFGCYSKFQSELGVLAFLGQYFPRAYLTRFLTFW